MKVLNAVVFCIVAAAATAALAVDVTFDASSDLSLFNRQQFAQFTPIPWSPAAGIGGGGGLSVTGSHTTNYAAESFDLSQIGAMLDLAAFFQAKDPGVINPGNALYYSQVYATDDIDRFFGGNAFEAYASEDSRQVSLGGILWNNNHGFVFSTSLPKGTVQPGHWYQLKTRFEYVGQRRFNWDIKLDDYGTTGAQLVETVASLRKQETDSYFMLNDTTLFGGFGVISQTSTAADNFSAASGMLTLPTQRAEITPTFDVELKVGASTQTIIEGDAGIRLGRDPGAPSAPASEALLEFPLSSIPAGSRILSATLELSPNVALGTPRLKIHGYRGDGLASVSDAVASYATLHAGYDVDGSIEIPLNAAFLTSYLSASHLGIRVTNLLPNDYMFLNGIESLWPDHKLILDYYTPAGPGDFDTDGDVDADDLRMWTNWLDHEDDADADGDFDTDGADFLLWQRNLGNSSAAASPAADAVSGVPEPAGATLLGAALCLLRRRRLLS